MATPEACPSHPPSPELRSSSFPKGYVEDVDEGKTKPGPGRVLTRRGRAGEKEIVFISLLRFGAAEAGIAIASFRRQLESPIGEEIFRQVGPRSTA